MTHDDSLINDEALDTELDTDMTPEGWSPSRWSQGKTITRRARLFAEEEKAIFLGDDNMNPYLTDEMTDFLNDRITDYSAISKCW